MGLHPHYIHAYSPKRDLPCANSTLSILLHQCTFVSFLLVFKNKIARWQIKKGYKIWGRCINLQAHTLWPWVVVACGDMHGCPRAAAATLARHACFACTTMSRGWGHVTLSLSHTIFSPLLIHEREHGWEGMGKVTWALIIPRQGRGRQGCT
jgi:hypothetical protein